MKKKKSLKTFEKVHRERLKQEFVNLHLEFFIKLHRNRYDDYVAMEHYNYINNEHGAGRGYE